MTNLIIFLALMVLGYLAGTWAERRHYRSIAQREANWLHLPALTLPEAGIDSGNVAQARLVSGSAVISIDYFKRFLAALRNLFGGTVKSYETLIDRARREAVLRMKAEALGAAAIVNVRIETSTIGGHGRRGSKSTTCLEAVAYGTALYLKDR